MTTTLKDFLEVYKPKSPDEQKFVDKHVVVKYKDRNGNDDDVFNAKNIKPVKRKEERHGYEPGDDEKVYEEVEGLDEAGNELMSLKNRIASNQKKMRAIPGIHPDKKRLAIQIEKDKKRHNELFNRMMGKNEEVDLGEAVTVNKKNYSWGKMITVHQGSATSYPLHPEHQEKIRKLSDGDKTSFKDETGATVHARRSGDTVHLNKPGASNRITAVAHSHFTEEVDIDTVLDEALDLLMSIDEKTLTPAEMTKREEVVKAIKRGNPKMDKSMAYAIATKTAKRVAEEADLDEAVDPSKISGSRLANQLIGADDISKNKDGSHTIRRGFYYASGTSAGHADKISKGLNELGIKHDVVDHGTHDFRRFKGGASVRTQNHHWVTVKIHPGQKIKLDESISEADDGWYTHHELYGKIPKESWKAGWRYNNLKNKPFYHQPTKTWHTSVKANVAEALEPWKEGRDLTQYVSKDSPAPVNKNLLAAAKAKAAEQAAAKRKAEDSASRKEARERVKQHNTNVEKSHARFIADNLGNHFPDTDGYDHVRHAFKKAGVSENDVDAHIHKIVRKHLGAKSYGDYVEKQFKQFHSDTGHRYDPNHKNYMKESVQPWMGKDLDKPAYLRKKEYEANKKDANPPKALRRIKEDRESAEHNLRQLNKHKRLGIVHPGLGRKVTGADISKAMREVDKHKMVDIKALLAKEEQIDELSKKTLGSYISKAGADAWNTGFNSGNSQLKRAEVGKIPPEEAKDRGTKFFKNVKKGGNRLAGIDRAVKKLTKEDIINRAVDKYVPEDMKYTPEERLLKRIDSLTEAHIYTLLALFETLTYENQNKMIEIVETHEGINEILNFALENRGE